MVNNGGATAILPESVRERLAAVLVDAELTTALDSLASQLAPRLAPLTREPEIQAVLREAFHQLRDHFAREDE